MVAYFRGLVSKEVKTHGGMAAIGLGRTVAEPLLKPGVVIACENSPSSVTISGDAEQVEQVMSDVRVAFPDAAVRALRVDCAYHSHHMKVVEEQYLSLLPPLAAEKPTIPYYSSVKGDLFDGDMDGPYWVRNLLEPVLFSPAVSAILKSTPASAVLLEVGPHPALAGPIRQILQATRRTKVEYAHTLTRGVPGPQSLLTTAGRLFQLGGNVDMARIVHPGQTLTDLPLYPWHREGPFWGESRLSKQWRLRNFPTHDLLGDRVAAASDLGPTWRNLLRLNQVPWLRDHKVAGDIVFPAAGYMAMAGEAVRQLVDVNEQSFSLREVHISSALVLQEGTFSELITHVRPVKLTNNLNSAWHEFDISTFQGDRWVRHAYGQVRSGVEYITPAPAIERQQRHVEAAHWYKLMERAGLAYGPHFQRLRGISAGVLDHKAVATIASPPPALHRTNYPMHPSSIDLALQLYSVAQSRGQARRYNQLAVPSYIGSAFIRPVGSKDIHLEVTAEITPRGTIVGDTVGVCDGNMVFQLQKLRMSPLADADDARGDDPHAAAEMVWKPDIRLVDHSLLFRTVREAPDTGENAIVERMVLACAIEAHELLSGNGSTASSKSHLVRYLDWLRNVHAQAVAGTHPNVSDCMDIGSMSSQARRSLIEDLFRQASETSARPIASAIQRTFQAIQTTLSESNGVLLDVFLDDDFVPQLYDHISSVDAADFYRLASHYKPDLRILEIGGGKGTYADTVLQALTTGAPHKGRQYGSYTLTNSSTELLEEARLRLAAYEAVECKLLDISKDPVGQGFEVGSFDLIIASYVST
jgi:acyl transferase domain-containing protein